MHGRVDISFLFCKCTQMYTNLHPAHSEIPTLRGVSTKILTETSSESGYYELEIVIMITINPDYTDVLYVGSFAWFLSYVIF